jgi:hypothetical protein
MSLTVMPNRNIIWVLPISVGLWVVILFLVRWIAGAL